MIVAVSRNTETVKVATIEVSHRMSSAPSVLAASKMAIDSTHDRPPDRRWGRPLIPQRRRGWVVMSQRWWGNQARASGTLG